MTTTKLIWHESSHGVIDAASSRAIPAGHRGAHYTIEHDDGLRHIEPDADRPWLLTFIFDDSDGEVYGPNLGRHPNVTAAKAAADRYEQTGEIPAHPQLFTAEQHAQVTEALAALWAVPGTTPADAAHAVLTALARTGHIRA